MTVTVKDVAKLAGVAPSTVSRVINDNPNITEATKEKVRAVMRELNYTPNIAARNLGKNIASAIGIILPPLDSKERLSNPFFLETMDAISEEAHRYDLSTAIVTAKNFDSLLLNVKSMVQKKQADGFVLLYANSDDPVLEYLYQENVPFTLIGQPATHEQEIVYVDNDNQLLGKQATEYLIQNGHKHILFVTNTTHENVYFERYFGYQKALMLHDLTVHDSVVIHNGSTDTTVLETIKKTHATALVALDDLVALRVMQVAQSHNINVPDDLSLISFNNSIFTTLTHPHLTSIDIEVSQLGQVAMAKLYEKIHQKLTIGVRLVIPHTLVERETVKKLVD